MSYLNLVSDGKWNCSCCIPSFFPNKDTRGSEKNHERKQQKWAASMGQVNVLVKMLSKKLDEEKRTMEQVNELKKKATIQRRKSFYNLSIPDDIFFPSLHLKIVSNTIPLPLDSPFNKTDLKVFNNNYVGILPNNGIRESAFLEISQLLSELKKDKKVGSLFIGVPANSPSPNPIKMARGEIKLFQMIVQLCTREVGRQIVLSLIRQDKELRLIPSDDLDPCSITDRFYFSNKIKNIEIYINPDLIIEPEVIKNGKPSFDVAPLFIVLGHEMLHALNHFQDQEATTLRRKTRHRESKNLEEYYVITGWKEEEAIPQLHQESDDFFCEWVDNSLPEIIPQWDSFSENSLRSVFGLPPRTNSYSNKKITTLKARVNLAKKPFFDAIKSNRHLSVKNYFTKEFMQIIGLKYDWKTFLNKALEEACKYHHWEIVIQLVEHGADPSLIEKNWKRSLDAEVIFALAEENDSLVHCLVQLGAVPPQDGWEKGFYLALKLKELFFYELISSTFCGDFKSRFTTNFRYEIERYMHWVDFLNEAAEVAAQNKSWEIVQQLIQEGATTDIFKHKWGEILDAEIVACCQREEWNRVFALIKLDANPHQKIGNSENLITFACEHYHPTICHLLGYLIKECHVNPDHCLYSALNTENPSLELISFLIRDCSADPNCFLKKINPLWLAVKRRHFDLIQPLIELGADPSVPSTSYQRFSLLHALATKQDAPLELFEFLVDKCKMDPLAISERGVTAISLAEGGIREKLQELIEKK